MRNGILFNGAGVFGRRWFGGDKEEGHVKVQEAPRHAAVEVEKEEDEKAQEEEKGPEKMILIAGLGGLGTVVASYLARMGLPLVLADPDVVERKNLSRQILYTLEDVGRKKVDVARERLGTFARVDAFPGPAQDYKGNVSIVVDCADDWNEKRKIWNRFLGKVPIVFGTVGEEYGCVGIFIRRAMEKDVLRGTRYVHPPLPGAIGSIMAFLVWKIWKGETTGLEDKLLCINFRTWETTVLSL